MELDFTALSGIAGSQSGEREAERGAGRLQLQADNNAAAIERAAEVYRLHQEATKRAELLVTDIRNGILSGKSIYSLFLQAMQAVELCTGEAGLSTQAEADLVAIYGKALGEPAPMEMELQHILQRLERLNAALLDADADAAERIRRAIRQHERERDSIRRRLERDG